MAVRTYMVVAERHAGEQSWSLLFPNFPGVTSVAEKREHVVMQARDALQTVIDDMQASGDALPLCFEEGALTPDSFSADKTAEEEWAFLLPIDVAGPAIRINISIDQGLLSRVDAVALHKGQSRSAILAEGARLVLTREREERATTG